MYKQCTYTDIGHKVLIKCLHCFPRKIGTLQGKLIGSLQHWFSSIYRVCCKRACTNGGCTQSVQPNSPNYLLMYILSCDPYCCQLLLVQILFLGCLPVVIMQHAPILQHILKQLHKPITEV